MKNESATIINIHSDKGVAIALEARRLADKYGKDFLEFEDLQAILPVGKSNIRNLMQTFQFPSQEIGARKVVGVLALAAWSIGNASVVA